MSIPYFYFKHPFVTHEEIELPEESSKHIVQVLRKMAGDTIRLTDGEGGSCTAVITEPHKKRCRVRIEDAVYISRTPLQRISIAISPLKNTSRLEWFLEKATEIGVDEIIPLITQRTEKQHIRTERLNSILISAMLQSQQIFLPELREPVLFSTLVRERKDTHKWIAFCEEAGDKTDLTDCASQGFSIILIGPEGDFTEEEVAEARQNGFVPVSLGNNRLRTETAGVTAAVLLKMVCSRL